ncbi:hypothetical protein WJX77_011574 [Trebouxia sp. C0004]
MVHQSAVVPPAGAGPSLMQPVTVKRIGFLDAVKKNLPQAEVTAKSETITQPSANAGRSKARASYAGSSSAGRSAARHASPSAIKQPSADIGLGQNAYRHQKPARTGRWQTVSSRRRHNTSQVTADATINSTGFPNSHANQPVPSVKNKRNL